MSARDHTKVLGPALVAALLLAACGGNGNTDDLFAQDGAAATQRPATGGTARAGIAGADTDLADADVEAIGATYATYLELLDLTESGDAAALEQLKSVATPNVVEMAAPEAGDEQSAASGEVDLTRRTADISALTTTDDGVVAQDCLELRIIDAGTSIERSDFVDQLVAFQRIDNSWIVSGIEISHDGTSTAGRLGCAPRSYAEETEGVVSQFLDAKALLQSDPTADVAAFEQLVSPDLFDSIEAIRAQLIDSNTYSESPHEHRVELIGSDAVSGSRSFVVGVCTYFADGWSIRSKADGEVVEVDQEPGSATYEEFGVSVLTEPDSPPESPRAVVTDFVDQQSDSTCWNETSNRE
jgi:hypothetical protein